MASSNRGQRGAARQAARLLTMKGRSFMLYEKLNPEMRSTVDAFASCIRPLPWEERSDLLAEAARPFADRFEGEAARLALESLQALEGA